VSKTEKTTVDVFGAELSRGEFVKTAGALIVTVSAATTVGCATTALASSATAAGHATTLDPHLPTSWFEIHADNTILMRTGKVEFGQGSASVALPQIAAEELNVRFDQITKVVTGDTDRTPDGGPSAGYLLQTGTRKAAAYTYQALLLLASEQLGVPVAKLTAKEGVISGAGRSVTYGRLVQGRQLNLTIPVSGDLLGFFGLQVTGEPPLKPKSNYTVIGRSHPMPGTQEKVTGEAIWVGDMRLPGMLHARMIHPRTLGSTLISVGKLDKTKFPNARVAVRKNLVAVVAPNEWEAILASQTVAADTKWSDWKGLPTSKKFFQALRSADWSSTPVVIGKPPTNSSATGTIEGTPGGRKVGDVGSAMANSAKKLSTTYEFPYMKHAPIGPAIALADVRADGTVHVWVHNQNTQVLRGKIARMLRTSPDNVVIRILDGTGHYGRSNGGTEGVEGEAVILSQAVERPVRVQWMRQEDFRWSTQSGPELTDVHTGVDANGNIVALQADYHSTAMQDDRLLGAILAGLPVEPAPAPGNKSSASNLFANTEYPPATVWGYDKIPNVLESGHGTYQTGQRNSPLEVGLRDHSMRTPWQMQQNFSLESAINEAAAAAGVDPIEFRIRHTSDARLVAVLNTIREASGWQTRPSPSRTASASGSEPVTGQGMCILLREGTVWASVAKITVVPSTGSVKVDHYTVALEPGIVINPRQLKRITQGGSIMGISQALHESASFDESAVTSDDWKGYPILTMAEIPEIKVILLSRPDATTPSGAGEASNALAPPAIAAAFFDATGKPVRSLPLRPDKVKAILRT
jgi:CO/xanthine dehydrogenase Mo-binding subunit